MSVTYRSADRRQGAPRGSTAARGADPGISCGASRPSVRGVRSACWRGPFGCQHAPGVHRHEFSRGTREDARARDDGSGQARHGEQSAQGSPPGSGVFRLQGAMTSETFSAFQQEWRFLATERLGTRQTIRLVEGAVELAARFDVNIRDRAFEMLKYLVPAATQQTVEEQIDELYGELRELARSGNESAYQERLADLSALEEEQAQAYEKYFDEWRPLRRDESARHLKEARMLLRK